MSYEKAVTVISREYFRHFNIPTNVNFPKNAMAVLALYVIGLVLNSMWLFPHISEINYFDEVVYIASGKHLVEHGQIWPYPRGPVISFIYAVIYLFVPDTEYWFLTSDVIGRVLAHTLLFIISWLVGNELERRELAPALLLVGLFTALPVYLPLLPNPSYWTFMVFIGLSLWLVLVYARTQDFRVLAAAGAAVGLALLSRPDVVFLGSFVVAVVLVARPWPGRDLGQWRRLAGVLAIAAGLPIAFASGYIVIDGLRTGAYQFGGHEKMYETFERAQRMLLEREAKKGLFEFEEATLAEAESRRHFGTPEENKYSVLRAIARNPSRFALMVWTNTVERTGVSLMQGYGQRTAPVVDNAPLPGITIPIWKFSFIVFFFAAMGVIELLRRRQWVLLAVLAVWLADMSLTLLTISYSGYYVFHFLIVFLLAATGIWAGLGTGPASVRRPVNFVLWAGLLALVCYLDWNPDGRILYLGVGGAAFFAAVALFRQSVESFRGLTAAAVAGGLLLVNMPVNYRHTWPGEDNGYLAQARYLRENFTPMYPTLAHPGIAALAAKMWWRSVWPSVTVEIRSKESFYAAMKRHLNSPIILMDPYKFQNIHGICTAIQKYSGDYYHTGYESPDGRFKVLVPNEKRTDHHRRLKP